MPEVSEDKLRILNGAYQLLSQLDQGGDTGRAFRALVKKIKPEIQTPEDIAEPYVNEVKSEIKEIRELVTKRFQDDDDAKVDRELNDIWQNLRKDGMTEEAKSEVAKMMKDRKIGDPQAAWALYQKQNPPAPTLPAIPGDTRWGGIAQAQQDNKELFTNPDEWAQKETAKILDEFRSNRAA